MKETGKQKTTNYHSAELIGYQMKGVMFKYCTVLISKYQSLKTPLVFK